MQAETAHLGVAARLRLLAAGAARARLAADMAGAAAPPRTRALASASGTRRVLCVAGLQPTRGWAGRTFLRLLSGRSEMLRGGWRRVAGTGAALRAAQLMPTPCTAEHCGSRHWACKQRTCRAGG